MLRVVFMGTPEIAVPTLAAVIAAGHAVVAAYSQAPRPAGRGMKPRRSPIHVAAEAAGIEVRTPRTLRNIAEQERFAALGADVAVVVAYGLILPPAILAAPRHGCLNMHGSALPRWRGAAPIQRAIMAGDTMTAAMVMRMDEGLDTGPVCLADPIPIGPDTTAGELHDVMAARGAALMAEALARLQASTLQCLPQPTDGITYAAKIDKAEAAIDWRLDARAVHNHIRGLSPYPGAYLEIDIGGGRVERIKVLRSALAEGEGEPGVLLDGAGLVACGRGAVRLVEVQRAGKRAMPLDEMLRGFALPGGTHLSLPVNHPR